MRKSALLISLILVAESASFSWAGPMRRTHRPWLMIGHDRSATTETVSRSDENVTPRPVRRSNSIVGAVPTIENSTGGRDRGRRRGADNTAESTPIVSHALKVKVDPPPPSAGDDDT